MKCYFTVTNDLNSDQRMIRICNSVSKQGHEVTLVGRLKKESQVLIKQSFQQHRIRCFFEKGKLFYLEYNIRLFFYLASQSIDILTNIDLDTTLTGILLKRIRKFKFIYDAHELFPHVPEVISRPRIQKFWNWVESKTFPNIDAFVTVSDSIAEYYQNKYPSLNDISVIRNVPSRQIKIDGNTDGFQIDQPFILYQGALNEGRGLERLLKVLSELPYTLVLIGRGDIENELKKMVKDLKLGDRVIFLGFVLPEHLPYYTQKARIGYNVSENLGLSYYFSLNNKFFDYVKCSLPSVINRFPEYEKLVGQYEVGTLVDPENIEIKNALVRMMEDDSYYNYCKDQCQKASQVWNWEVEELKLKRIYNTI